MQTIKTQETVGIVNATLGDPRIFYMRQQTETLGRDPLSWERLVAANAPQLMMPLDKEGLVLRLTHLPVGGPEIIWDFIKRKGNYLVRVTRLLESLREKWEKEGLPQKLLSVTKEISQAELPVGEPVIREIEKGIVWGCRQGLENRMDADHYFLWFQNNKGFSRIAAITNPFSQPHSESWQRLINRAIGSGLLPPRRFAVNIAALT